MSWLGNAAMDFWEHLGLCPNHWNQRVLSIGFLLENKTDLGRRDCLWRTQEMLIQLLAVPEVPRLFLGRLPLEVFHLHSQMLLLPPQHLLAALSLGNVCVGCIPELCLHSIHHSELPAQVGSHRRTLEWMMWWEGCQLGNIIYKMSEVDQTKTFKYFVLH